MKKIYNKASKIIIQNLQDIVKTIEPFEYTLFIRDQDGNAVDFSTYQAISVIQQDDFSNKTVIPYKVIKNPNLPGIMSIFILNNSEKTLQYHIQINITTNNGDKLTWSTSLNKQTLFPVYNDM